MPKRSRVLQNPANSRDAPWCIRSTLLIISGCTRVQPYNLTGILNFGPQKLHKKIFPLTPINRNNKQELPRLIIFGGGRTRVCPYCSKKGLPGGMGRGTVVSTSYIRSSVPGRW